LTEVIGDPALKNSAPWDGSCAIKYPNIAVTRVSLNELPKDPRRLRTEVPPLINSIRGNGSI
jgi:hypothetical protein